MLFLLKIEYQLEYIPTQIYARINTHLAGHFSRSLLNSQLYNRYSLCWGRFTIGVLLRKKLNLSL